MELAFRDDEGLVGNETVAQDLYGVGVRIGLYLQGVGMILCMLRSRRTGNGVKLASGGITISILTSWTVTASKKGFSPCEAYLVLFLLTAMMAPGKMVLFNVDSLIGEGLGLLAIFLTELWMCAAYGWFFARLYGILPLLGTENVTFFFAKVALDGWFRIFMLVLCVVLDWPTSLWWSLKVIRALWVSVAVYRRGATEMTESERKAANIYDTATLTYDWNHQVLDKVFLQWKNVSEGCVRIGLPIFLWIFSVTTVETTIVWNNLSPSTDLTSPGQLIPFITGIIVLTDGILVLFRPAIDKA